MVGATDVLIVWSRIQVAATAGVPEQADHAHGLRTQGQQGSSRRYGCQHLQVCGW